MEKKRVCFLVTFWLMLSCFMLISIRSSFVAHAVDQTVATIYFIDVGQGDAVFIDTVGLDVLIDGGTRQLDQQLLIF
jgi:beta-lactamase superfamily II metal-dependent hydrolase